MFSPQEPNAVRRASPNESLEPSFLRSNFLSFFDIDFYRFCPASERTRPCTRTRHLGGPRAILVDFELQILSLKTWGTPPPPHLKLTFFSHVIFVMFWSSPSRPQEGPRGAQEAPRPPQERPKRLQEAAKSAPGGSKRASRDPKSRSRGLKTRPRAP